MFIVIDGLDGAGKTSLIDIMKENNKRKAVFTREPGGTPFSEKIRNLIFENESNPLSEAMMMYAARIEHSNHISKLLSENNIVVSDRYIASTYVYQSEAGEENLDTLKNISNCVNPDIEILLYCEYSEYKSRKFNGSSDVNRLDPVSESDYRNKFESLLNYSHNNKNSILINTTNISAKELYNIVDNHIDNIVRIKKLGYTSDFFSVF